MYFISVHKSKYKCESLVHPTSHTHTTHCTHAYIYNIYTYIFKETQNVCCCCRVRCWSVLSIDCPKVFANISTKYPYPYSYNVVIVRAKSDKSFLLCSRNQLTSPHPPPHALPYRQSAVGAGVKVARKSCAYPHIPISISGCV